MSKKRVEKYIRIEDWGHSASERTKVWRVYNFKHSEVVGWIKWYGGFRKYCFYLQDDTMLYDSDCMILIANFLDEANKIHLWQNKRKKA